MSDKLSEKNVSPQGTRKILVTSALPYANGPIHIGHLVEHIQSDVWVRFQKMRGHQCTYVCADDTHGTPIMIKARELGLKPEEYVARSHQEHTADFKDFQIGYDHYSSTHSEENRLVSEEFFAKMRDGGHIDVREIMQLYCSNDKMFLPDRFVKGTCPVCATPGQYGDSCDNCGATYAPTELKDPHCSLCGTTPVLKGSEHIFFKLNDFKDFVQKWMPEHTQKEVAAKLMEWFESDLRDWDISRDAPYFGFEIPGFKGKYFYVWVDAPIGYISSSWQWAKKNGVDVSSVWKTGNTEIYHFIGKDITYFHCVFWPAMLKAAGYKQPTQVFVHGFLTVNGEKMSKSKGTAISARTYLSHMDPMYIRYYFSSKLSGAVNDIDLNAEDFVNRVNSDLIGKITNLGSRGAQMLSKRIDGNLGGLEGDGANLVQAAQSKSDAIAAHFESRDYSRALIEIREIADEANKYFDLLAPWNLIKTDVEGTRTVLTATLNMFRLIAIYLTPVLPAYSEKVAKLLGEKPYLWSDLSKTLENRKIGDYEHLATRVEKTAFDAMIQDSLPKEEPKKMTTEKQNAGVATQYSAKPPATDPNAALPEIDFEEFAKTDLRIAKIIAAEEIVEADKLLRLKVSLGPMGERQIIAGIKSAYRAEDLVGRLTVVVANLKPRKMKFGMSEGMVLAAGPGGKELFILSPDSGAEPGQKVK
jgi:methionyl-tRNA synthetase